jgi:hypothetical protein
MLSKIIMIVFLLRVSFAMHESQISMKYGSSDHESLDFTFGSADAIVPVELPINEPPQQYMAMVANLFYIEELLLLISEFMPHKRDCLSFIRCCKFVFKHLNMRYKRLQTCFPSRYQLFVEKYPPIRKKKLGKNLNLVLLPKNWQNDFRDISCDFAEADSKLYVQKMLRL